ncbi:LuxR C-terminal-related transcriptional regulator [Streptomyces sp. NPDC000618]|uniref:LuxR C-terminal-related transcriptional regulator n=1 Tax=Streptomyces sp. NPDC000618 TaxID=3154265 RepID=UPI003323370C
MGRRRDIAEIRNRLDAVRLLTLTGPGGVGKTRLALESAGTLRERFPDGIWLVDLAPVQDPSAVASAAAAALHAPDPGTRSAVAQLAQHLARRRALIVLDNCEHQADACAGLIQALLPAAPELRVLATSRHTLHIPGEHVVTVMPLPERDAVELLRERATAVRAGRRISDAHLDAAKRLCADLDGLPLAIELAASRLRTLTLQQVLDTLEERSATSAEVAQTAMPRQRTLRAAIGYSYELCDPAERLLWNRASVFAGSFSLDAAEAVCSGNGIARPNVLDLMDRLVAQSVVLMCRPGGRPRYRMLETIREYGRERLAESGEQQHLVRRHRDFYLGLAQDVDAGWHSPRQVENLARLRTEHDNLLAALARSEDPHTALALTAALRYHWCAGGFLGEGRRWFDRTLAKAPDPTPLRAEALLAATWVALLQGDSATADRWLAEADVLSQRLNLSAARAHIQVFRGLLAVARGQLEDARDLLAAAVARTSPDESSEAIFPLFQLTLVQAGLGDPRAAETGRRALALAEACGDKWGRAHVLWALGYDALKHGDPSASKACTRAALELKQGFNDHIGVMFKVELLAWATVAGGQPNDRASHHRAAQLLGAAHALLRDIGTDITAFGPHIAEEHARCERTVVRTLGSAAYRRALAEGDRRGTPAQAIHYALSTGSEPVVPTAASRAPDTLTGREQEVAALLAQSMSNRQIASLLGCSLRTIDNHVRKILAKLGFGCRTQVATWWTTNQAVDS